MASPRKSGDERLVSRTYRAAIRIGEDFITLEETITLPLDASDEDVTQAVDLGWRVYRAQREAVEAQIAGVRESVGPPALFVVRDPDAPASEKQRNYVAALQEDLAWTNEQLTAYADEQHIDLVTLSKGQASTFIDGLKKLAEERGHMSDGAKGRLPVRSDEATKGAIGSTNGRTSEGTPINEKQVHALERLAQQQALDLDSETHRRFGVVAQGLTFEQASALLREWQRSPQSRRTTSDVAL